MKLQSGLKVIHDLGYKEISYNSVKTFEKVLEQEIRIVFYASNVSNTFEVFGSTKEARANACQKLQDFLASKGYETITYEQVTFHGLESKSNVVDITNLQELGETIQRKSRFT
jgi:endo-1,4-beta-D-glucanase Y